MVAFNQYRQKLKVLAVRAACLIMVTVAVWGGAWVPGAAAVGSEKAGAVMNERAAAELDRMSGEGTSDQLKGAVQDTVGKAKRGVARATDGLDDSLSGKLDNTSDRMDGAADELKGEANRNIGKAKGAAADASDDAKDKAQGIVESIKDFFD